MQTTFCCSASALATILLLFIGLMAATSNLQFKGQQAAAQIVDMPKISLASKSGPWPKCIGMTGEDCVSYIEENANDDLVVMLVPFGSMVTTDFRTDRVRVFVDENDIVFAAPSRG